MTGSRPNILLIMADEHDPRVTGCYGDPIVETPHLNRLASHGTVFDCAYTTSPLCVPARLSFISGKYISKCKVWNNNCRLPTDDYPSLPGILSDAGYECMLSGKMDLDPAHRHGYRELFPNEHNRWVKDGTGSRRDPADRTAGQGAWENRYGEFGVSESTPSLDFDRKATRETASYLQNRNASDGPFFLTVGYFAPHFPLTVPEEYYSMYEGRVPLPDVPEGIHEKMPVNYRQLRHAFGLGDVTPEMTTKGRELYWAYVSWLDNQIGIVLDALENSAVADSTIVIYTSDHGENKGDHGLWWKNNMYEHAARVPLIIRFPGSEAGVRRTREICSHVDLTRTIAEMANVDAPDDWDGRSLLDSLKNGSNGNTGIAVSEYYGHNVSSGFAMIRKECWKYVYHTRINAGYGPERELYDLDADPGEMNNLASRTEHTDLISALHEILRSELGRDPEEAERECREEFRKGYQKYKASSITIRSELPSP